MGVLSGKDVYSNKWITADIVDAGGNVHFIPIKSVLGDYFVTDINKQVYVFRIEGGRVKTWQKTLVKSFRKLYYDTSNYMPIAAGDTANLEEILTKNSLPRVNMKLFKVLKILSQKEKQSESEDKKFTPHVLKDMVDEVGRKEKEYPEIAKNLKTYIDSLQPKQIVMPVKKLVEFLEDDLLTTDPKFLGTVLASSEITDFEHKKITNTPVGAKLAWVKWAAILALIGIVIAIAYLIYDSGVFSNIIPNISLQPPATTPTDIMSQYPTPEALKAAIDRGEISYDSLPKDIQTLVDSVKLPTIQQNP